MRSTRGRYNQESETESDEESGDELMDSNNRITAVAQQGIMNTLKFKDEHVTFYSNCKLSALVAFWITLFGLPSFSPMLNHMTFGNPDCLSLDIGTINLVYFENNTVIHAPNDGSKEDILRQDGAGVIGVNQTWCGFLPRKYLANWPNVVQMIVFTVYMNTGVTIQQAWQGIAGTWAAVVNHWIMSCIYPNGANNFFVWLNILGFFWVVLCSGCAENTMKFSMNWHCWFMMTFLATGPTMGDFPISFLPHASWDSFTTTSLITASFGALIAVVATLFPPPPISNYRKVSSNAKLVHGAMRKIWTESIDYFCGREPSIHVTVIAESITNLNVLTDKVLSDLTASWWEGFDLCGMGKKRQLYREYDTMATKMDAVMVAVKDSILKEGFDGNHVVFCDGMKSSMEDVKDHASALLELCETCCQDGNIDDSEVHELANLIKQVEDSQANMLHAYRSLSRHESLAGAKFVSQDLANENTFVFALSVWARKITESAGNIIMIHNDQVKHRNCLGTLLDSLRSGFFNTWKWPDRSKMEFAVRNWVVIAGLFVLGYEFSCNKCVFTDRSANMAALVTLLINHYSGSAFLNNLKRLLGVIIGKVLPVIILSFMDPENNEGVFAYFDCSGASGTVSMAVLIFAFSWFFNYMYYTSKNWGLIGCLAAAFGCSGIIPPCGSAATGYQDKYKEIAQDVFAIFFGLFIDELFDWLNGKTPRDAAVSNIKTIKDDLEAGFTAIFSSDLEQLEKSLTKAKTTITQAQEYAYEADPSLAMVPGFRTEFKVNLYKVALELFHLLHSDLAMLLFALRDWVPDPPPKDGNDDTALEVQDAPVSPKASDHEFDPLEYINNLQAVSCPGGIKDQLMDEIEKVFSTLHNLLAHDREGSEFQDASKTKEMMIVSTRGGIFHKHADLYTEINGKPFVLGTNDEQITQDERVKVTVICRALENTKEHLSEIQTLLAKYIAL